MRRSAPLVLAAFLAFAVPVRAPAQTQNLNLPDLGGVADIALSPQAERRLGESIMRDIRRDPDYVEDPEITDYLDRLGDKLVNALPGANQDFEFFAVRDPAINAFALPGGFVGVNTGLINIADNESELASVLAHEITHVTQRHIARLLSQQQQMQLPTMAAMVAAILLGNSRPDLAAGAAAAASAGNVQAQIRYTRSYEEEADRIGFQRLVAAGFDPQGMPEFFEKMQRYTRLSEDGSVPTYLRDHPVTTERIADAENRAAHVPYHQHADSIEFGLVRAKLRAQTGDAGDQVTYFQDALRDRRYASEAATRYGLVVALLRAGRSAEAATQLTTLRGLSVASPMIDGLAARVSQARGDRAGALAILRAALSRYPDDRPLTYAYVEALQDAGRNQDALGALFGPLRHYPSDEHLHMLLAKTYAGLGKRLLQHQAQAEVYVLQGSLPQAIEQLQLAQSAGDGDFYQLSAVDARLRELRSRQRQQAKDAKRN
jgi:predicted Zn-dependent protease